MSGHDFDHLAEDLDIIEEQERLAIPEEVIDAMERSFSLFGFENFIITGLQNPKQRFVQAVVPRRNGLDYLHQFAGLRGPSLTRGDAQPSLLERVSHVAA